MLRSQYAFHPPPQRTSGYKGSIGLAVAGGCLYRGTDQAWSCINPSVSVCAGYAGWGLLAPSQTHWSNRDQPPPPTEPSTLLWRENEKWLEAAGQHSAINQNSHSGKILFLSTSTKHIRCRGVGICPQASRRGKAAEKLLEADFQVLHSLTKVTLKKKNCRSLLFLFILGRTSPFDA